MDKKVLDLGIMSGSAIKQDFVNPIHLRYTVTLDHDIDDKFIAEAWNRTKKVYPLIDCVLRFDHGNADFYLQLPQEERYKYRNDHMYLVQTDNGTNDPVKTKIPIAPASDTAGGRLICISYYERTVSISAYHVLVDGGGLNMIFSTFLYSYLALYTGHEDKAPVVELTEGRSCEEYYTASLTDIAFSQDCTPVPLYSLPRNCFGFYDKDMVRDEGGVLSGNIKVSAADFMKLCKENGANPSSMLCAILAKATYSLVSDEEDMVFSLTVSMRKQLSLENDISNTVGIALAYATCDESKNKTIAEISQRIRRDVDSQRSRDYCLSFLRVMFDTYRYFPKYKPIVVTYMGSLNIGDNNGHIVDFSMETDGASNIYMMQLNDRFIITLQYGKATGKYLDEFKEIFSELGVKAEITHPAHYVSMDSKTAVL